VLASMNRKGKLQIRSEATKMIGLQHRWIWSMNSWMIARWTSFLSSVQMLIVICVITALCVCVCVFSGVVVILAKRYVSAIMPATSEALCPCNDC
jgi:hypothetical protein